jgi:hypothetical protein
MTLQIFVLDEDEFNELGYEFYNNQMTNLSFETFRVAIFTFPGK